MPSFGCRVVGAGCEVNPEHTEGERVAGNAKDLVASGFRYTVHCNVLVFLGIWRFVCSVYFCGHEIIKIWVSDPQRTCDGWITCSSQRWGYQGRSGDVMKLVLFIP